MQEGNLRDHKVIPGDIVNLVNSFEGTRGVTFVFQQTPTIYIIFKANVSISEVALLPTPTSNIIKFQVVYITPDNKPYVDPKTGQVLKLITPDGDRNFTFEHEMITGLKGLNVTLLQTSGGRPSGYRLKVEGCYKPSKFICNLFFLFNFIHLFFFFL